LTIADPRGTDCPVIAVSDDFEAMSGYGRHEILQTNMRCMNAGCRMDAQVRAGLRAACQTGAPFTAVVENRKKSGEIFHNLLDLRGLTVARDASGQDIWFLVGVAADVSTMGDSDIPDDHMQDLRKVAIMIRRHLASELSAAAIVEQAEGVHMWPQHTEILETPKWRPGDQLAPRWARKALGNCGLSRPSTLNALPCWDSQWTLTSLPDLSSGVTADSPMIDQFPSSQSDGSMSSRDTFKTMDYVPTLASLPELSVTEDGQVQKQGDEGTKDSSCGSASAEAPDSSGLAEDESTGKEISSRPAVGPSIEELPVRMGGRLALLILFGVAAVVGLLPLIRFRKRR